MRRLSGFARVAVALTAVLAIASAATATAAPTPSKQLRSYDKKLLNYVNHARVAHGLKPFKQSNRLYKVAHAWAAHEAKTHTAGDDLNWTSGGQFSRVCPKATTAGANDGYQTRSSPKQMFENYKAEPIHWANMQSPRYNPPGQHPYTYVGIATVKAKDGSEWNAMYFANHCA